MRSFLGLVLSTLLFVAISDFGINSRLDAQPRPDSVVFQIPAHAGGYVGGFGWTPIMVSSTRRLAGVCVPFKIEGTGLIVDSLSAQHSIADRHLPFVNFFSATTRRGFIRFVPDFNGYEFNALSGELFRIWWHIPPNEPEDVALVDTCFAIIGTYPGDTVYARLEAADWGLHDFNCSFIPGGIPILRYECGDIGGELYWVSSEDSIHAVPGESDFPDESSANDGNRYGIDIDDARYLVYYVFHGWPPPLDKSYGDINCDGMADISDVVYLVNFLFNSGQSPCANCPSN